MSTPTADDILAKFSDPYILTGELASIFSRRGYELRRTLELLRSVHARRKLRLPGDFDGLDKLSAALPGLLSTVAELSTQCATYCGDLAPDGVNNCCYDQYTCDTARSKGPCVCGLPGGEPQEDELPNADNPFYSTGQLAQRCVGDITRYLGNAAEMAVVLERRKFRDSKDPKRVLLLKQQLVGVKDAAEQLAEALKLATV